MKPPANPAARPAGPSRPSWGMMLGWVVFFVLLLAGLALAVLDGGSAPILLDSISS